VSLDKVESSNQNLKAAHAGGARKTGPGRRRPTGSTCIEPKASDVADAEGGCFAFSRLAYYIRVLSKSEEKPALLSKTTI
jgi:hypothetical protein